MVTQIEIPDRLRPEGDNGYFEELTKAIFRAGFSWRVIREKWPAFQTAFNGFNLETVASYGQEDIDRLFNDASIVRNRRKILGAIDNAARMLELDRGTRLVFPVPAVPGRYGLLPKGSRADGPVRGPWPHRSVRVPALRR